MEVFNDAHLWCLSPVLCLLNLSPQRAEDDLSATLPVPNVRFGPYNKCHFSAFTYLRVSSWTWHVESQVTGPGGTKFHFLNESIDFWKNPHFTKTSRKCLMYNQRFVGNNVEEIGKWKTYAWRKYQQRYRNHHKDYTEIMKMRIKQVQWNHHCKCLVDKRTNN
jgi:hypothetical protein